MVVEVEMMLTKIIGRAADAAEVVVRRVGDAGGGRGRAIARRAIRDGRRTAAYTRGRLDGLRYAAAGRHPDENVSDDILADRVRTALGPVLRRLDLPRVHVTVERHVVTLHGDAGSLRDIKAIGQLVAAVPGVTGVRSALHVGLLPGASRPSWGRQTAAPSAGLRRLLEAADRGGVGPKQRPAAVSAVLSALATWLSRPQWQQLRRQLPADVRVLGHRRAHRPADAGADLVTTVSGMTGLPGPVAAQTVQAVAHELADLVPAAAPAITAALPEDLRGRAGTRD
jgi:uncharacterized protein (DUF2267 family)